MLETCLRLANRPEYWLAPLPPCRWERTVCTNLTGSWKPSATCAMIWRMPMPKANACF